MIVAVFQGNDLFNFFIKEQVFLSDLQVQALGGLGNLSVTINRDVLNFLVKLFHGLWRDTASTTHVFNYGEKGTRSVSSLQTKPYIQRVWLHNRATLKNLMQTHVQHPESYSV